MSQNLDNLAVEQDAQAPPLFVEVIEYEDRATQSQSDREKISSPQPNVKFLKYENGEVESVQQQQQQPQQQQRPQTVQRQQQQQQQPRQQQGSRTTIEISQPEAPTDPNEPRLSPATIEKLISTLPVRYPTPENRPPQQQPQQQQQQQQQQIRSQPQSRAQSSVYQAQSPQQQQQQQQVRQTPQSQNLLRYVLASSPALRFQQSPRQQVSSPAAYQYASSTNSPVQPEYASSANSPAQPEYASQVQSPVLQQQQQQPEYTLQAELPVLNGEEIQVEARIQAPSRLEIEAQVEIEQIQPAQEQQFIEAPAAIVADAPCDAAVVAEAPAPASACDCDVVAPVVAAAPAGPVVLTSIPDDILRLLPPVSNDCWRPPCVAPGENKYFTVDLGTEFKTIEKNYESCSTKVVENVTKNVFNKQVVSVVNRNHHHVQRVVDNENNYHHYNTEYLFKVNDIHRQRVENIQGEGKVINDYKQTQRVEGPTCQNGGCEGQQEIAVAPGAVVVEAPQVQEFAPQQQQEQQIDRIESRFIQNSDGELRIIQ